MKLRFVSHLGWTAIALAAFSLGYFTGRTSTSGIPAQSGLPTSAKTAISTDPAGSLALTTESSTATVSSASGERRASITPALADAATLGAENLSAETEPRGTVVERAARAMLMGSDLRRQRTFLALLEEMQPADAIAIRSLLAKSLDQGVLYENLWEQFWMRWGEIDGAGAMKYILETQKHESVPKDIARVMRGWGAAHPGEAARWLEEHQGQENLGAALIGLTDGYASEDLNGATSLALEAAQNGDPLLKKLMETLSEQAIRQGRIQGLTSWFERLPSDGDSEGARAAALGHVYWRLWKADQDRALDWVQQQSSRPWRSDLIIGEIAQRVAQTDPAKAFTWLQNVPPSPKNGSYPGIGRVVRAWFTANPQAAAEALQSLGPGAFRDQAIAAQQSLSGAKPTP